MNQYNPHKHHRRSIRLKGYDYSQAGLYFITLCVQNREHLFGRIKSGEMILNAFGKIVLQEWFATEQIRDNCKMHEFIVMPNHIHGIIEILFQKETDESEKRGIDKGASDNIKLGKGESDNIKLGKGESDNKELSKGELQFAPTAPTAPTAPREKFKSPSQTIGSIIRGFKIATIKKIKDYINRSSTAGQTHTLLVKKNNIL